MRSIRFSRKERISWCGARSSPRSRKERITVGCIRRESYDKGTEGKRDLIESTRSLMKQVPTLEPYRPDRQELHPFQWLAAITLAFSPYILLLLLPRHVMRITSPERVKISTEILYQKLARKSWFVFENMLEKQFQIRSMQEGRRILERIRDVYGKGKIWKPRIKDHGPNESILAFGDVEIFVERMDRTHHKDWIVVMEVRIFGQPTDPDVLRTIHAVEMAYESFHPRGSQTNIS